MKVSLQIFNPQKTMARILDDKVGIFTAETCARYFNDFVPMRAVDGGTLSQTHTTEPFKITYEQQYAHNMYTGVGYNFSTEKHANATSYWDKAAMTAKGGQISKEITEFIKRR